MYFWWPHLDMVDVDTPCNAWDAVQLPHVVLQIRHLMDEVAVALEVGLHVRQCLGEDPLCSEHALTPLAAGNVA